MKLEGSGISSSHTPLEKLGKTPSLFALVKFTPKNDEFQYCRSLLWLPILFRPKVLLLYERLALLGSLGTTANQ